MTDPKDDILKGVEEVAEFLEEKPGHVGKAIRAGTLPHYRTGRLIRARKSTLSAWMAEQEKAAFPQPQEAA